MVLGQPDFTQNAANNGNATPSARSMNGPLDIYSDGKKLFIVDINNRRVLIWNTIPNSNFVPADVVLGQPDFSQTTINNGGVSARSMSQPSNIFSDGKKLFVSDQANHRVLIWNKIPDANFAPADVVLGQPDFASSTVNNGGVSASSFNTVQDMFSDGKKLFVGDASNRRILIWDKIPTTNFAPADIVLGQPDFTQNTINNGGISARSTWNVVGVFSDGKRLFAADRNNHRVLIWSSIPTSNFTPADVVLGQPDFASNTANNGGISARSIFQPRLIFSDGRKLFVTDQGNHRLLIWNKIPTENFTSADIVLGQPDFVSGTANNGGVSARSFNTVRDVFLYRGKLFVSDQANHRVLVFNVASFKPTPDPQFEQGKAVVGKVFHDVNGNGIQDTVSRDVIASPEGAKQSQTRGLLRRLFEPPRNDGEAAEQGIEGVKVVSDTGIYAITDHDGKYHFPYIETGQRVLKLDESTLPEGSTLTTDNPYKATITKGILTKVSFGVRLPESSIEQRAESIGKPSADLPLLEISITQDTQKPTKTLGITAELITPKDESPQNAASPLIKFTTQCNYYLFIKESEIKLYDENTKEVETLKLPNPIPLYYEIPLKDLPKSIQQKPFYYQLVVKDAQGRSDRTRPVKFVS